MLSSAHLLGPYIPKTRKLPRHVRARHEAQDLDDTNANHWLTANSTSPNEVCAPDVREKIRNKVRHEQENSESLGAILQQYSGEFIGTGPRLQIRSDDSTAAAARNFEQLYSRWWQAAGITDKLTLLVESEPRDGESFLQAVVNPALDHKVKLDFRVRETEEIATPDLDSWLDPTKIDGIVQDAYGNVTAYHVLREHPGTFMNWGAQYDQVPAETIIHWFRPYRAGQGRGISAFSSTVEICGMVRRYAKAQLQKHEISSHIVATMEVDGGVDPNADTEEPQGYEYMDNVPVPRGGFVTTPKDSNVKVLNPANNQSDYTEYMAGNATRIGRPVLAPRNLATGDSSNFNFASGKLDQLPWQENIHRQRDRLRRLALDKILKLFYAFALGAGLVPPELPALDQWAVDYHWDGFASINPEKDVQTAENRIRIGVSNLAIECAALGYDWREIALQRAKELKFFKEHGLNFDLGKGSPAATQMEPFQEHETDETEEDTTLENAVDRPAKPAKSKPRQPTLAATENVQATALNGAQITSLVLICDKVQTGAYPAAAAVGMIEAAFPMMDRNLIQSFVSDLASNIVKPVPAAKPEEVQEEVNV